MLRDLLSDLRFRFRALFRHGEVERELAEELQSHIEVETDRLVSAGLPHDEARRQARLSLGGVEQVKEATRDAWFGASLATGARELRYALRTLRRAPGFLVISILTLAIGIGGATAVFTVIKGSLLRPLPAVADPDRLVTVERVSPTGVLGDVSYPDFHDFRAHATTLAALAAYDGTPMALVDSIGSTRVAVGFATKDFFDVLGVRPAVGRFFSESETEALGTEANGVVVLGYKLWQARFGGSSSALGSTLRLDGRPFTVVGVAPPGFIGAMEMYPRELFIPLESDFSRADLETRRGGWFRLIGHLAPGKSVPDVQAELSAEASQLAAAYSTDTGLGVRVFPGAGMLANERAVESRVPRLLTMAVAMLLLIACGNVASLSLVRSAARRRELATRLALGASRAALVRQVALEGVVIAAGAALLGIVAAQTLLRSATLVHTMVSMPDLDLKLDARVLAVAVTVSALTAILVSLMPAMQIFRVPVGAVLKDGGGAVRRSTGGQRVLVTAQVGASLALLCAAAVVFGAFHRVIAAHDVFDPRGLTDVMLQTNVTLKDAMRREAFYRAVLASAASDPELAGAALTSTIPPFQWSARTTVYRRGDEPPPGANAGSSSSKGLQTRVATISPDFFDVMRMTVQTGRTFTTKDDRASAPVVILGRRLADALWPGRDPIGEFVGGSPPLVVVGVAADTRDVALTATPPLVMYVPFTQQGAPNLNLVVRGRGSSVVSAAKLRRLVADVDPGVPVLGGSTLYQRLQDEFRPQRTASAWIGVFGIIALLLASIGLYGVVSQSVLQRTRELAVRSALGASPGGIRAMVLGDGMRLAAVGTAVGGLGAVVAFRTLRSTFTEVRAVDVRLTALSVAVLAIAMLAATYLPARRASRLNPVDALRCD